MKNNTYEKILSEREKTHGLFASNARVSQTLYNILMSGDNADKLTFVQAEALNAKCQKMARIVNGDANFPDHWLDQQGYCELALKEISEKKK